ncbi:MAG TPA: NAD-dependent epimerase/dehydratase family protein [Candidatus Saccharimonadales bacterium]|nr:NAD-dependent epimerase/dehydratase family protein [Candidatus Saccharimonadales bacterium]
MRIIITGAAGFMGSHLFDLLTGQGHEVVGIDNYSIGKYKHPSIKKLDLVKDSAQVSELILEFKPQLVYHLAAWAHEGLSQFAPIRITENNYNAFLNTLIPSIKVGIERFLVTSSMSVYGDQNTPFDEEMKRKPVDIYAVSKTAMEEALEILSAVHNFEYVIIRPHNVYGPRQVISDPYRNVVGIFMNRIMNKLPPIIYGDGDQTRAFSYIDDVNPYIAKAGFLKAAKNQIINIGPLENYSINFLAKNVLKAFKSKLKPIYMPDRPTEVKHAFCTNDKAQELLGYKTSVKFEDGIEKMTEWAKQTGPQKFLYLDSLELINQSTPKTWVEKII